jgi:hypothetical protein
VTRFVERNDDILTSFLRLLGHSERPSDEPYSSEPVSMNFAHHTVNPVAHRHFSPQFDDCKRSIRS